MSRPRKELSNRQKQLFRKSYLSENRLHSTHTLHYRMSIACSKIKR